jgi:hypothetical protein
MKGAEKIIRNVAVSADLGNILKMDGEDEKKNACSLGNIVWLGKQAHGNYLSAVTKGSTVVIGPTAGVCDLCVGINEVSGGAVLVACANATTFAQTS